MKIKWVFYLFLVFCTFCTTFLQAQDLAFFTQNDAITNEGVSFKNNIHHLFIAPVPATEQVLMSTYYQRKESGSRSTNNRPRERWRFGLQGGLSYMLAGTGEAEKELQYLGLSPDDAKDYYKRLKWGNNIAADAHILFNNTWGVGIKYSLFTTSVKEQMALNTTDGINYICVNQEERLYVNFIGLSFYAQQWLNRSNTLKINSSVALGYAHYRNELDFERNYFINPDNYLATGKTIGSNLEISFEYYPLSWLSIAANIGCFTASFGKLDISNGRYEHTVDLDGKDRENVSRLDGSLGIRFYIK